MSRNIAGASSTASSRLPIPIPRSPPSVKAASRRGGFSEEPPSGIFLPPLKSKKSSPWPTTSQREGKSMMTLRQLAAQPPTIPTRTAWYLADLGEALGKQELFTRQSPQRLKVLREHALIESAVSSKNDAVAQVLGRQVLRSGTAVGANYREASRG